MNCERCDEALDAFELDTLCEDCHNEWYNENHFECCFCGEYEENSYHGAIGSLIVIGGDKAEYAKDPRRFAAAPGVYRIIKHPYFLDLVTEASLFRQAVERVADTNKTESESGHACRNCSREVK